MSPEKRMHVVYCVTSSGNDVYEAMTRVSLATLRMTNPQASVTLACDTATEASLSERCSLLLVEVDQVLSVATEPGMTAIQRNRFVKTSLRQRLTEPFLFLDSDIVIKENLAPLAMSLTGCDIAAAANHSRDDLHSQVFYGPKGDLSLFDWEIRRPYVNGGFLYFADSDGAAAVGRRWHDGWLRQVRETGTPYDQETLNRSIVEAGADLKVLDHRFNAQLATRPEIARGAAVWHVYSSSGDLGRTWFGAAVDWAARHPHRPVRQGKVEVLVRAELPKIPLWHARERLFVARRAAASLAHRMST